MTLNPFAQILRPYFDWLSSGFGDLAKECGQSDADPAEFTRAYLADASKRLQFRSDVLPTLCQRVIDFWKNNGPLVKQEIAKLPGFRARFGADVGPQLADEVFGRAGLYFHTVIVADPLLTISSTGPLLHKQRDFYFIKHVITLLLTKDVYLADVYPPIAVLDDAIPLNLRDEALRTIAVQAQLDCVLLTNELYCQNFDQFDQLRGFYSRFSNPRHAAREIVRPELFFLHENVPLDPVSQIEADIRGSQISIDTSQLPPDVRGPNYLLFELFSRLINVNAILFIASAGNANPLVIAPISYHWLEWKMRANSKVMSERIGTPDVLEFGITNALLSKNLDWLANVPLRALIELRKKGALEELRSIFRQQTSTLSGAKIEELPRIMGQVDYNISAALARHQQSLSELDWRFRSEVAITGPTFLLALAAAFQPFIIPASPEVVKILSGVIGSTSLAGVFKAIADYLRERRTTSNVPIGILWQARQQGARKKRSSGPEGA